MSYDITNVCDECGKRFTTTYDEKICSECEIEQTKLKAKIIEKVNHDTNFKRYKMISKKDDKS